MNNHDGYLGKIFDFCSISFALVIWIGSFLQDHLSDVNLIIQTITGIIALTFVAHRYIVFIIKRRKK